MTIMTSPGSHYGHFGQYTPETGILAKLQLLVLYGYPFIIRPRDKVQPIFYLL